MSFFDRIGNLGKGLLQSALSGDADGGDSPPSDQQERLRSAFEQGRLSTEEYREKLRSLSERLSQARSKDRAADSTDLTPAPLTAAAPVLPRTGLGTGTTAPADPAVEDA